VQQLLRVRPERLVVGQPVEDLEEDEAEARLGRVGAQRDRQPLQQQLAERGEEVAQERRVLVRVHDLDPLAQVRRDLEHKQTDDDRPESSHHTHPSAATTTRARDAPPRPSVRHTAARSHFLTFSLSHVLTFSLSHFLAFSLSHFLTFSLDV
jgi:hypothetical protein